MAASDEEIVIDALWREEAEKRLKEIQTGTVKPIPGDDVFEEIKQRYG